MNILYYIIPQVLVFRQHNGDDPPQDLISLVVLQALMNVRFSE